MKNKIKGNFRIQIALYSVLSLFLTIISECIFIFLLRLLWKGFHQSNRIPAKEFPSMSLGREPEGMGIWIRGFQFNNAFSEDMKRWLFLFISISVLMGVVLFIVYFLLLTKKFVIYIDEIFVGIDEISKGNFESPIRIRNDDEFSQMAARVNQLSSDIKKIMELKEQSDQSKNDLITSVAHDLRTPLTSILGYLDLVLKNHEMDEKTKQKYLTIAYEKSFRLEGLIQDLFSYTKLSIGDVVMKKSKIDIKKLMEQMVDEFYPSFQEVGLELELSMPKGHVILEADGDLMARALANLIGNAVKYGRDGKRIKIRIEHNRDEVNISIVNYGILISGIDLELIFERFYRAEDSRSRETGGTGLGLDIARQIVQMHDGTIAVTSDYNGTMFRVTLPLAAEQ